MPSAGQACCPSRNLRQACSDSVTASRAKSSKMRPSRCVCVRPHKTSSCRGCCGPGRGDTGVDSESTRRDASQNSRCVTKEVLGTGALDTVGGETPASVLGEGSACGGSRCGEPGTGQLHPPKGYFETRFARRDPPNKAIFKVTFRHDRCGPFARPRRVRCGRKSRRRRLERRRLASGGGPSEGMARRAISECPW